MNFTKLKENHIPLLASWLQKPHIIPVWQEPEDLETLTEKYLIKLPQQSVYAYIIEHESKPIGYIQYYSATKVGNGWWPNEPEGTYGIDLMIGEEDYINKGLGPKIITEFINEIRLKENIKSIIIDPEPTNTRAIRAFEKAGFKKEAIIKTPNGEAQLMRINF